MVSEPTMIVIEGQIGVGKTSLGEVLERELRIPLFRELTKDDTHRLLSRFYADKSRWAFTLQIHMLNERFRMIKQCVKIGRGVLDRSIFGDHVFASMLHDDGDMTDEEYNTYDTLLANMIEQVPDPKLLVYLDCSPDTALARIKKRNRGREAQISRNYLENLERRYLAWYDRYQRSHKMKIDTEHMPLDQLETRELVVKHIRDRLPSLQ